MNRPIESSKVLRETNPLYTKGTYTFYRTGTFVTFCFQTDDGEPRRHCGSARWDGWSVFACTMPEYVRCWAQAALRADSLDRCPEGC